MQYIYILYIIYIYTLDFLGYAMLCIFFVSAGFTSYALRSLQFGREGEI
jgi:hypothetical protein